MNLSVIFGVATLASLILALKHSAPLSVSRYLWCQLLYIPPVWGAHLAWGDSSPWYAAVYVLFTLPILAAIAGIVWEAIKPRRYRLRSIAASFVLAMIFGRMSYLEIHRTVTYSDWINLTLGVVLVWAGTLLGHATKHLKRDWDLCLILSVFWTFQALSCFGWLLHLWKRLNWVIDPSLGILAFLLLAWRLKSYNETCLATPN